MFSQRPNRNLQLILSGVGNIDSGIAKVTITVSGTDVYADTATHDAETVIVSLVPSSTEEHTTFDSNTGKVTITPRTATEIRTHFDSNTAIVVITGIVYETKKSGVVHRAIPPRNTLEYADYLLSNLEREIEILKNNKRPTFPIYDRTQFPNNAVNSQIATAIDYSLLINWWGWIKVASG